MKKVHLTFGILVLIVFLLTGQYMDKYYHHMVGVPDGTRLLYRTRHIFILLSGLTNLGIGAYFSYRLESWRRVLQLAHLRTVPFENLSIPSGEPVILDDRALFEKIVSRRRGGFCYELNGLFAALLRALGFDVAMLSAQVANAEGTFGPDFDHMT